ncbi:protein KRTCAP2 homolog [Musca vetustissima]|uniref:protein KRTCAP2 homolog n=1 Tax=Musca vetustissima TaxID=27455 RepID=UPI002AB755F5|nr:protein KRTCAP2 homolog [Musca vetustissima]
MIEKPIPQKAHIGSAIISCILSLVIYGTLRFYAEWFTSTQLTTIFGGFVSSFIFIFSLTSLSNIEMLLFGEDFACKFIPEIVVCLLVSVMSAGIVHRVCATTCILFSILALYFIDRISNDCYHKTAVAPEAIHHRKGGGKKNK